ncbi:MAG: non-canonical purine NTP pyrophosphatase [Betaproteobacteria bacterium]
MVQRLVLASHNAGKLRELQALFDPGAGHVQLLSPQGLGLSEPDEPYNTFLENALHKARKACAATGLPALADDSGLAVPALGGVPGVQSSTYAGVVPAQPGEDREALRRRQDAANTARLLRELQALHDAAPASGQAPLGASRHARFVCTLVALRHAHDPEPLVAQGRWDGEILRQPRGQGGFGYDPVMWIAQAQATVAELGHDAKNSASHRARAAALMRQQMQQVWGWALGD